MGLKIMFLDFIIIYLFLWFWNYNFLLLFSITHFMVINFRTFFITFLGNQLIFTIPFFTNISLLTIGLHIFSYIHLSLLWWVFIVTHFHIFGIHLSSLLVHLYSYYLQFHFHLVYKLLQILFWKSIHLEVASGPFCLLVNSPWLLVFALVIILLIFTGFNIYCWAGIQFSSSNFIIFVHLFFGFIFSFHFWSRDLSREFQKKYEILLMVLFLLFGGFLASEALLFVSFFWASFHSLSSPTLGLWPGETFYIPDPCELTFANTLLLSNAAVSLGGAFVSLEISSQFYIFFALFSFCLSSLFISL